MEYALDTSFYAPHRRVIIITILSEIAASNKPGLSFISISRQQFTSQSLMSCRNRYFLAVFCL